MLSQLKYSIPPNFFFEVLLELDSSDNCLRSLKSEVSSTLRRILSEQDYNSIYEPIEKTCKIA